MIIGQRQCMHKMAVCIKDLRKEFLYLEKDITIIEAQ